jgi:hypothetical protein
VHLQARMVFAKNVFIKISCISFIELYLYVSK